MEIKDREQELEQAIENLLAIEDLYLPAIADAAEAKTAYKQAYNLAMKDAVGSNQSQRDAATEIACEAEHKEHIEAETFLAQIKVRHDDARIVLEARRSLLANQRNRPI